MLNKGPAISHSENLPPWQWKRERAPVHKDPGGALTVSVNSTDPASLLQDGKEAEVFQVECVESSGPSLTPIAQGQLPAQTDTKVIEDGK